jgi:hypothetical protein
VTQVIVTVILAAVILAAVIWGQMRTRLVRPHALVIVPAVLAYIGISNLMQHPPHAGSADVAIAASIVTALILGVARGAVTQVWQSERGLMRKGTALTLVLWAVLIAIRLGIAAVARAAGVDTAVTEGEFPLFVGVTLAAQNVVISLRGRELDAVEEPTRAGI